MPEPIDTSTHVPVVPDHIPEVTQFPPPGGADRELEWFFTMAESDMDARSNFATVPDQLCDDLDRRAEAAHAQRKILDWLKEVGDHDAGVLKVAYVARPWPLRLREELGRVTGVVVRLATAQIGLPDDDEYLDALERKTAERLDEALAREGRGALHRYRTKGLTLLTRAFASYVRERGGPRKPILPGVT